MKTAYIAKQRRDQFFVDPIFPASWKRSLALFEVQAPTPSRVGDGDAGELVRLRK